MSASVSKNAATLIIFFTLIGGFVAYKMGAFSAMFNVDEQHETGLSGKAVAMRNTTGGAAPAAVDSPPPQRTSSSKKVPDSMRRFMSSSKSLILHDEYLIVPEDTALPPANSNKDSLQKNSIDPE